MISILFIDLFYKLIINYFTYYLPNSKTTLSHVIKSKNIMSNFKIQVKNLLLKWRLNKLVRQIFVYSILRLFSKSQTFLHSTFLEYEPAYTYPCSQIFICLYICYNSVYSNWEFSGVISKLLFVYLFNMINKNCEYT